MQRTAICFLGLVFACLLPISASADDLLCFTDPLAPRDEEGLLHQMPSVIPTDLAPHHACRFPYYFMSGETLSGDAAYVGALQASLYRNGYYCGPIDGVFSPEVATAIARLQKNSSQRVTGTLTLGVRRALHLP